MPYVALGKHCPGGVGHCLYDRFAVLALAKFFNLTPILQVVVVHRRVFHGMTCSGRDVGELENLFHISTLPGVVAFRNMPKDLKCKAIFDGGKEYVYWPLAKFRKEIEALGPLAPNDVIFLKNNLRLSLEDLYFQGGKKGEAHYLGIRSMLRSSFSLARTPRLVDDRIHIAVHVRSGDRSATQQPMDYALSSLKALTSHPSCPPNLLIHIVSAGEARQMTSLRSLYASLPKTKVSFDLNVDFFETLSICTHSSIVFVWKTEGLHHSGFHYLMRLYAAKGTLVVYPRVNPEEKIFHRAFNWCFLAEAEPQLLLDHISSSG
jgi:hypothetical protein